MTPREWFWLGVLIGAFLGSTLLYVLIRIIESAS